MSKKDSNQPATDDSSTKDKQDEKEGSKIKWSFVYSRKEEPVDLNKKEEKIEDDPNIEIVKYEYSLQYRTDFSLYIYPMHVIATNRILNTLLSRSNNDSQIRLFKDIKTMNKIYGFRSFFQGLTPYCINLLFNNVELFGTTDEELEDENGQFWFYFTLLMWNPMNIFIVRMQCADYPFRSFRKALVDMIKYDKLSMFYKGFVPIFGGLAWLSVAMTIAQQFEIRGYNYMPAIASGLFFAGALIAHPMYLVGMRVQYGKFHQSAIEKEAYSNFLKAIIYTKQQKQLYRGFCPALFVYGACYYEDLKRMVFDRLNFRKFIQ